MTSLVTGVVASGSVDTSGKSLSLNTTRSVPSGHTLFICVASGTISTPSNWSAIDGVGNAWNLVDRAETLTTGKCSVMLYAPVATALPSGSSITITCNQSMARIVAVVLEADDNLTLDIEASATGTSSNPLASTAPNASTTATGFVLTTFAAASATVWTPGSTWTPGPTDVSNGTTTNTAVFTEWKTSTTASVKTGDATVDSSRAWSGVVAAFKVSTATTYTGRYVLSSSGTWQQLPLQKVMLNGTWQ